MKCSCFGDDQGGTLHLKPFGFDDLRGFFLWSPLCGNGIVFRLNAFLLWVSQLPRDGAKRTLPPVGFPLSHLVSVHSERETAAL